MRIRLLARCLCSGTSWLHRQRAWSSCTVEFAGRFLLGLHAALTFLIAAMSSISGIAVTLQSCSMAEISGCLHQLSNGMQHTWGTAHITHNGDRHGDRHGDRQGPP